MIAYLRLSLLLCFFLFFNMLLGVAQTITTVAGSSFIGDSDSASKANLNLPIGLALDPDRQLLYIADQNNNRIRQVNLLTGIISTVAGNGYAYNPSNGVPATETSLSYPSSVVLDSKGNLYFIDSGNIQVRRVDRTTGLISVVAGTGDRGSWGDGGLAVNAAFDGLSRIAVDASDNIYVSDFTAHVIRKITISTGLISRVAGTYTNGFSGDGGLATQARLNYPRGIAIGPDGSLFICDGSNNRIRKVHPETGIITTVAGTGTRGVANQGDGGLALQATVSSPDGITADSAGNVYISDGYNTIRKVNSSTGIISTVAGNGVKGYSGDHVVATTARLASPGQIIFTPQGNLLIADASNHRIRLVNGATNLISTLAGNGYINYRGDGGFATQARSSANGVAVDDTGNIYIADTDSWRVRKIAYSTGLISTIAGVGTAGFSGDGGAATKAFINSNQIALDKAGNLYIVDGMTHRVRQLNLRTGVINTVAGTGTAGFSGDGGLATQAQLNSPSYVALDAQGNLYISDFNNNRVRKVAAGTHLISTVAGTGVAGFSGDNGPAIQAQLNSPRGLAAAANGDVYIADSYNGVIRKLSSETGLISTVAGSRTNSSIGDGGERPTLPCLYRLAWRWMIREICISHPFKVAAFGK